MYSMLFNQRLISMAMLLLITLHYVPNRASTCQMLQISSTEVYCNCQSLFENMKDGFILEIALRDHGYPILELIYRKDTVVEAQIHTSKIHENIKDILILNRYEYLIVTLPASLPMRFHFHFGEMQSLSTKIVVDPTNLSEEMKVSIKHRFDQVKSMDVLRFSPFKMGRDLVVSLKYSLKDSCCIFFQENDLDLSDRTPLSFTDREKDNYKQKIARKSNFPIGYALNIEFIIKSSIKELNLEAPLNISIRKSRSLEFKDPPVISVINGDLANKFNLNKACLIFTGPRQYKMNINVHFRKTKDSDFFIADESQKVGIIVDKELKQVCINPREMCGKSYMISGVLDVVYHHINHVLEASCEIDYVKYLTENVIITSNSEETTLLLKDLQYIKIIIIRDDSNIQSMQTKCVIDDDDHDEECDRSIPNNFPITCSFINSVIRCSHSKWKYSGKTLIFYVSFDGINYFTHPTSVKIKEPKDVSEEISNFVDNWDET